LSIKSTKGILISKDATDPEAGGYGGTAREKALLIASALRSKHAEEIVIFQVQGLTALTDFFVLCSAGSKPQMKAISDEVERLLSSYGEKALGIEGREAGVWALLDYNDVILHIFKAESRAFYNLDRLWGDAPKLPLPEATD